MSVKSELLSPYLERTESLLERGKALKHINRTECLSLNLSCDSQVIHLIIMTLINITRRKLIVLWPKCVTPSVASACLYIYIYVWLPFSTCPSPVFFPYLYSRISSFIHYSLDKTIYGGRVFINQADLRLPMAWGRASTQNDSTHSINGELCTIASLWLFANALEKCDEWGSPRQQGQRSWRLRLLAFK